MLRNKFCPQKLKTKYLIAVFALLFLSGELFFSFFSAAGIGHHCDHHDTCYICKCIQAVNSFQTSLDVPVFHEFFFVKPTLFTRFDFFYTLSITQETPVRDKVKKTE